MCEMKSWIVYTLFLVLLHCLTTRGDFLYNQYTAYENT